MRQLHAVVAITYMAWGCIPNSVTTIGRGAFTGCEGLTSVSISDSITSLEDDVFAYCSNLTTIIIGSNIKDNGFDSANNDALLIPATSDNGEVLSIGKNAFSNCRKLTSVICLSESIPTLDSGYPFYNINLQNVTLYVPESSVEAYKSYLCTCTKAFMRSMTNFSQNGFVNNLVRSKW